MGLRLVGLSFQWEGKPLGRRRSHSVENDILFLDKSVNKILYGEGKNGEIGLSSHNFVGVPFQLNREYPV